MWPKGTWWPWLMLPCLDYCIPGAGVLWLAALTVPRAGMPHCPEQSSVVAVTAALLLPLPCHYFPCIFSYILCWQGKYAESCRSPASQQLRLGKLMLKILLMSINISYRLIWWPLVLMSLKSISGTWTTLLHQWHLEQRHRYQTQKLVFIKFSRADSWKRCMAVKWELIEICSFKGVSRAWNGGKPLEV